MVNFLKGKTSRTAVDKAYYFAIIVLSAMESWSLEDQTIGQ